MPRHQGSCERGNRQIKDMIDAFEEWEKANGNPNVQWPSLLPRIMVALNAEPKKTLLGGEFSTVSPYFAVYGMNFTGPFMQHKLDVQDMRKFRDPVDRVIATRDPVLAERLALLGELTHEDLEKLKEHGTLPYLTDKAKILIATKDNQLMPEGYNWPDIEDQARQQALGPALQKILALKKQQEKEMLECIKKCHAELTCELAEKKAKEEGHPDMDNVSTTNGLC